MRKMKLNWLIDVAKKFVGYLLLKVLSGYVQNNGTELLLNGYEGQVVNYYYYFLFFYS